MSVFISIDKKEYIQLLKDSRTLQSLYAGGVENWDWYGDAMDEMEHDEEFKEFIKTLEDRT